MNRGDKRWDKRDERQEAVGVRRDPYKLLKYREFSRHIFVASPDNASLKKKIPDTPSRVNFCLCVNDVLTPIVTQVHSSA